MGWGQQLSYPQTGGSAEEGLGTTRFDTRLPDSVGVTVIGL